MIEAVNQFQLDLALIEGSCHLPQLQCIHWLNDELAVCCSPEHPLAQLNRALTPEDFLNVEWILREEGSGTREVFDNAILQDVPDANIRLTLGHNEAILKLSPVVWVCRVFPNWQYNRSLKRSVGDSKTPFWELTRPLHLLVHRQKYQGPGLKAFMNFCENRVNDI